MHVNLADASYLSCGDYSASVYDGIIELRTPYSPYNKALSQGIAGRIGRGWNSVRQCWRYYLTRTVVSDIVDAWDERILDEELMAIYQQKGEVPDPQSKSALWHHQEVSFQKLYPLVGGMIAFDMGTGKTAEAITLLDAWGTRQVIVLGPRSALSVWPAEFAKHSIRSWRVVLLKEGAVARRTKVAIQELSRTIRAPIAFVINYAAAIRPEFKNWSLGQHWDAMVLDECHHVKSPSGVQSRYAHALSRCASRRLGLTGTPLPHSFPDIYAQYRALDSSVFGTSFTRFKARFCVMGGYQGYEVLGMRDRDVFERRLNSIMVRVTKDDVFDLPPSVIVNRTAVLSPKERSVYDRLENEFWVWLEEQGQQVTIQNALVKLVRLQQITSGFIISDQEVYNGRQMPSMRESESKEGTIVSGMLRRGTETQKACLPNLRQEIELSVTEVSSDASSDLSVSEAFSGSTEGSGSPKAESDMSSSRMSESRGSNGSEGSLQHALFAPEDQRGGRGAGTEEKREGQGLDDDERISLPEAQRENDGSSQSFDGTKTRKRATSLRDSTSQERDSGRQSSGEPGVVGKAASGRKKGGRSLGMGSEILSASNYRDDRVVFLGHTKEQLFEEFLEDLPRKEPLVVFCRFIIDLENIQRIAIASGRTVSLLCGGTDELADWRAERTDVLVCQIQAGSEGIDLTRSCQCVFYSMGFSLAQHEQAKARLDRAGQTRSVTYTYLIVEKSIDARILRAVKARKQIVEAILQEAFDE